MVGYPDEALVRSLFNEYGSALLAFATHLTGERASAEDVVQETLVRAWHNPEPLVNEKGSARGWLFKVARNIATDRFPARASRPQEVAEATASPPVDVDHAERAANSLTVVEALDQLSAVHRSVLVEVYFHDRSVAEVAEQLGIPPGAVKPRTYHALKALKAILSTPAAEGLWP
jgi:RNA polymerase sigma-70 factor (ECF subfamily)